jgi:TfoX/Sxy family transcriptional regulator of competence genes
VGSAKRARVINSHGLAARLMIFFARVRIINCKAALRIILIMKMEGSRRKTMAYNQEFAQRIRDVLGPLPGLEAKKMFGGMCYLLNGNMLCGVVDQRMIVRLGKERQAEAMTRPHTRPFDYTGKAMSGWLMVDAQGCATEEDLADWVQVCLDYVRGLPPK